MPEVEHGEHVLAWLYEVGPIAFGPNGAEALSWQEINAWKQATETAATSEELVMLRTLSLEYVSQLHAGEDPNSKDPSLEAAERSYRQRSAAADFDAFLDSTKKK